MSILSHNWTWPENAQMPETGTVSPPPPAAPSQSQSRGHSWNRKHCTRWHTWVEFYLLPYRETIGEIYRMTESSLQNASPALMHSGVLTVEREELIPLLNQLATSFCHFKFVIRDIKNGGFFLINFMSPDSSSAASGPLLFTLTPCDRDPDSAQRGDVIRQN